MNSPTHVVAVTCDAFPTGHLPLSPKAENAHRCAPFACDADGRYCKATFPCLLHSIKTIIHVSISAQCPGQAGSMDPADTASRVCREALCRPDRLIQPASLLLGPPCMLTPRQGSLPSALSGENRAAPGPGAGDPEVGSHPTRPRSPRAPGPCFCRMMVAQD